MLVINTTTSNLGSVDENGKFTEDIEDVAVNNGSVFVLHHTGVVSSV